MIRKLFKAYILIPLALQIPCALIVYNVYINGGFKSEYYLIQSHGLMLLIVVMLEVLALFTYSFTNIKPEK